MRRVFAAVVLAFLGTSFGQQADERKGYRLESMAWPEAEPLLNPQAVVVIPVAPASLEHGPHLPLRTDLTIAEALASRLVQTRPVVVAPAVTLGTTVPSVAPPTHNPPCVFRPPAP